MVNSILYFLRKRYQLDLLPPEMPSWRCLLRWPALFLRRLWILHVLLPAVERKRAAEQIADMPSFSVPPGLGGKLQRIGLFCEDASKYGYIADLGAAFRAMGIAVACHSAFLEGGEFSHFLEDFRPDFVFEINRSRHQIRNCNAKFHHIAWIQDFSVGRRRITAGFGGSDKVYSIVDPEILAYTPAQVGSWSLLQFAVDPMIHRPIPSQNPRWDVSTIGFLASPPSELELQAPLLSDGVATTLSEIHTELLHAGISHSSLHVRRLEMLLLRFMRARNPDYRPDDTFAWLMALYEDRILRSMDRADYLRKIMLVTNNVMIFGNGHWKYDKELSLHLGGKISGGDRRAAIYCLSKIVFHNGNLLVHDRSLEAMACGRCVIMNHSSHENSPSGITPYFSDMEHFAFFDKNTISQVTGELLSDAERRTRIGRQARERVLAGFTWQHRAQQIARDFLTR